MLKKIKKVRACPSSCARVDKIQRYAGTAGSNKEPFLRSGRGFTLLEVMLAVAFFSLVMTALYSTFLLSHRALDVAGGSLLKLQEACFFLDTLKREIESTVFSVNKPYTVFKIDDRDYYGRQTSQINVTSLSNLRNGLSNIKYVVEEKDERLILTKSITTAYIQDSEDNWMDLLEDVASFTLEVKIDDKWAKTWDSRLAKRVPEEVRITLSVFIVASDKKGASRMPFSISEIAKPRIGKTI